VNLLKNDERHRRDRLHSDVVTLGALYNRFPARMVTRR
jgi:hypothetical protein